jgi:hypothetical protein
LDESELMATTPGQATMHRYECRGIAAPQQQVSCKAKLTADKSGQSTRSKYHAMGIRDKRARDRAQLRARAWRLSGPRTWGASPWETGTDSAGRAAETRERRAEMGLVPAFRSSG